MCSCYQCLGSPCLSPSSSSQRVICICYRAERDISRCVGTSYHMGIALSIIYWVACFGLWSICFPVWIGSSQGREFLENCRFHFEISFHRMVHTRNRYGFVECRTLKRLEARRTYYRLPWGSLSRKEQRPGSDFG